MASSASGGFSFVVIGDTPYTDSDVAAFPELVNEVNAAAPPFLIHVGDIKAGGDPCTDELIERRAAMYEVFSMPFIYTPGDNEWTDCHQSGRVPLERLSFLREVFFEQDRFSGPAGLIRQSESGDSAHAEFVENARWSQSTQAGRMVFATAHVVGSDNGREDFPGRIAADDGEVARRDAANASWVTETFAMAERDSAVAVVIAAHADLRIEAAYQDGVAEPFSEFTRALERGVAGFDGPVVLLQGDTHSCRFDQPAFGVGADPYPNFWRIRVAGGGNQVGWFLVSVDPAAAREGRVRVEAHMLRGVCRP